jgi:hypothetical protein
MSKQTNDRFRFPGLTRRAVLGSVTAVAPCLLLACAGDVINLGEQDGERAVPPRSRCQSASGSTRVETQEQLDALEGCQVIAGDLDIVAFPGASLRSLYALRSVEGHLVVGGHTPVRPPDDERPLQEWLEEVGLYEQSIVGWLPSLEGLEHLEAVDSLSVTAPVSSLLPLSGLRRINTGSLGIQSDVLPSLAGLENVRGFDSLGVVGIELRDISAVTLPETMRGLHIRAPIATLKAEALRSADRIDLVGTELADLDALEGLEGVGVLSIMSNPGLRDMDGLNAVRTIGELYVQENDALERLGDFASLTSLELLQVQDNDNLTELPGFPAYYAGSNPAVTERPVVNVEQLVLRGNERLRQLQIPAAWKTVGIINISDTHLEGIDFFNVQSVGTLVVWANPSLSEVQLGALSSAAYLEVQYNQMLPATAFAAVHALESHFYQNGPAPDPASSP